MLLLLLLALCDPCLHFSMIPRYLGMPKVEDPVTAACLSSRMDGGCSHTHMDLGGELLDLSVL
jgi:hypothetical protein